MSALHPDEGLIERRDFMIQDTDWILNVDTCTFLVGSLGPVILLPQGYLWAILKQSCGHGISRFNASGNDSSDEGDDSGEQRKGNAKVRSMPLASWQSCLVGSCKFPWHFPIHQGRHLSHAGIWTETDGRMSLIYRSFSEVLVKSLIRRSSQYQGFFPLCACKLMPSIENRPTGNPLRGPCSLLWISVVSMLSMLSDVRRKAWFADSTCREQPKTMYTEVHMS